MDVGKSFGDDSAGRLLVVVGASMYISFVLRRGTRAVLVGVLEGEEGSGGRGAGSGVGALLVGVTASWDKSTISGEEIFFLLGNGGGGVDGSRELVAGVR